MAEMDGERWARSLFYVVLSGCLIAATISGCVLLGKLGGSAEALVEIEHSRLMREKMTGDLILESVVWTAANVMEHSELATAEERKEISDSVIETIGSHNKNLGRLMAILDREAQESGVFKKFVEDIKEGVEEGAESSEGVKDFFMDVSPDEGGEPDESESSEEVDDFLMDAPSDEGVEEGDPLGDGSDAGGGADPFGTGGGDPFGGKPFGEQAAPDEPEEVKDVSKDTPPDEGAQPDGGEPGGEQAVPDDSE